jgi:siroheme synthase (precorrin-2 oxidase/ferrochelatase)
LEQVPVWAQEIRERIVRIETMLQQYDSAKATEAHQLATHLKERVERLESNQTWLWRTVIGALITGAVGVLFFLARGGGHVV